MKLLCREKLIEPKPPEPYPELISLIDHYDDELQSSNIDQHSYEYSSLTNKVSLEQESSTETTESGYFQNSDSASQASKRFIYEWRQEQKHQGLPMRNCGWSNYEDRNRYFHQAPVTRKLTRSKHDCYARDPPALCPVRETIRMMVQREMDDFPTPHNKSSDTRVNTHDSFCINSSAGGRHERSILRDTFRGAYCREDVKPMSKIINPGIPYPSLSSPEGQADLSWVGYC